MAEFRVVDHVLVTASAAAAADGNGAPDGGACSLPLTFFDVKWLHLPPVERVLLYRLPPPPPPPHHHHQHREDANAVVSSLKESLCDALRAFYPLAGHVRRSRSRSDRHELLYEAAGDGVPFTTAEYDVDVDDLASDDPVRVSVISPLVPQLPKGRNKVLAVQVTLLRRSGIALGVTIHHSACDGRSSTHFLHTWASMTRSPSPPPPPPVMDRTLIPDPTGGLYDAYLKSIGFSSEEEEELMVSEQQAPDDDRHVATFTLSEEMLQSIKSALACEAARRGCALSPRCSSLVAAYGLMWWCHCQTYAQENENDSKSSSNSNKNRNRNRNKKRTSCYYYFLLSVDQRARLKPSIPDSYLGNCMCPAIAKASIDDDDDIITGLYVACAAVATAIEEQVDGHQNQEERLQGCVARVKEAVANGTLSVAGSPRFRVYHLDFGFGRPIKVQIVSAAKSGAISVADSRAGGRGLELAVSLPPDAMDKFRKCFADAMDWIRSN